MYMTLDNLNSRRDYKPETPGIWIDALRVDIIGLGVIIFPQFSTLTRPNQPAS